MANCSSCAGRENPKEAVVSGPAVILGNGTTKPFETDAALDAWVAWKTRRGTDPLIVVHSGEQAIGRVVTPV